MKSVSKLYSKKGQLEWEAFNAGNDVLCFAENVAEGIQEILEKASPHRIEASYNRLIKCKQKAGILYSKTPLSISLDFEKTSILNRKIAENCITRIKGNYNTEAVFEAKKNQKLAKLSLFKTTDNAFFRALNHSLSCPEFSIEIEDENAIKAAKKNLADYETILISVFVPKAKPINNFGMEKSVLAFLKNLLSDKKCILYVFGNPYALQVIPNLESAFGVVQVYQDFNEFQESAATQLLENLICKGSLPVHLDLV
jgi:beta-N-acetylhexosaminidase